MTNNELVHHGVIGMKWGVRRYQNKDGSQTAAGKKRDKAKNLTDDELASSVRRMALEKQYSTLSKERTPASKTEKAKKVVDATSNLVNQAKKFSQPSKQTQRMDLSKMTDQELRDRINRTNLERQYNEMFASPAKVSKGKQYVSKVLEVGGSALAIGSSALGIALAIKELRG